MASCWSLPTVILLLGACAGSSRDEAPGAGVRAGSIAPAGSDTTRYTVADFQALRFLEGDWRGSGYQGGPFYETYRFVNDSTIEMTAWTDSTLSVPREQSQYMLRDSVIRTSKDARLVRVDDNGYHFRAAAYGWTFRRVSPDRWTAQVGPTTVYTMDRIVAR